MNTYSWIALARRTFEWDIQTFELYAFAMRTEVPLRAGAVEPGELERMIPTVHKTSVSGMLDIGSRSIRE